MYNIEHFHSVAFNMQVSVWLHYIQFALKYIIIYLLL